MAIPAIPSNVYLQQGNGQVFLSWGLVAGATSYSVQRSSDGVSYTTVATPAVNQYLDTSAIVGINYYYQVASTNASGTSGYSSPQSIVPTLTGQMTLGQVRLASQQRADRVGSNFVTLPEWNSYISQSAFELYDLLTTTFEDYFLAPGLQFITDGSTYQYALPDGTNYSTNGVPAKPFYKLSGIDCGLDSSNNARISLNRFEFIDRNSFIYPNIGATFLGVFSLKYKVIGSTIYFIPTPSAGQVITLWYQPRMVQPLQDTDILDGVSGWTEYVIIDAAIKALQKEESDVSVLMTQKQAMLKRIEETAQNRDMSEPATISDTRRNNIWGRGWGPNGSGPSGGW